MQSNIDAVIISTFIRH